MRPSAPPPRQHNHSYVNGANLGGWLVLENWLFPNVLLLRVGTKDIVDNQELDYIGRMRARGIDAVRSMHAHWDGFLCDPGESLLHGTSPPAKLVRLAAAGFDAVRIPIGWWALEAPTERADWKVGDARAAYEQPGFTRDGFVTGGAVYLRAVVRWLKVLGLRAVIDMHSLPGGAVRSMGYTGAYFRDAQAFDGADAWYADGNLSSSPLPPAHGGGPFLASSVDFLLRLARVIASFDDDEATRGVVTGFAPWNEALFADNARGFALLPPFTLKVVPQLRAVLPTSRYDLILNFFNSARDWPRWLSEHASALGGGIVADLHVYHAFDPPFDPSHPFEARGCPMCTGGEAGMTSLICKTCNGDAAQIARYRQFHVRTIVGEWSLGTCQMWGAHPQTISDPDFLYAFFAAAKSAFAGAGAEGDFFWTGVIATGGYDPTLFTTPGTRGSRHSILAEVEHLAQEFEWGARNAYVAHPTAGVGESYLLNWHLLGLAATNTSDGHHAVALPLVLADSGAPTAPRLGGDSNDDDAADDDATGDDAENPLVGWSWTTLTATKHAHALARPTSMRALKGCGYLPSPPARIRATVEALGTCDGLCGTERAVELSVGGTAIAVLLVLLFWCVSMCWRRCSKGRVDDADDEHASQCSQPPTEAALRGLQEPLLVESSADDAAPRTSPSTSLSSGFSRFFSFNNATTSAK